MGIPSILMNVVAFVMGFLSVILQKHAVIMIQNLFLAAMDNEFVSVGFGRGSQNSFPVRVSPLDLSNRHLLNKIRINHTKLPSQFFANPRSMPDLQLAARMPSLQAWRKRRQKTVNLADDNASREATRSLGTYKSVQRRRQQEQQRKINDLFAENDDLGVTFSRLPIKRCQNNTQRNELGKVYLNRMNTQGHEEAIGRRGDDEGFGITMKIESFVKGSQGINVRKNNHHPITTLREIKRQCM